MSQRMFIKFEEPGITGEASASDHSDEIEVLSWSHSFNQPTSATRSSAGGGTVEQANHSDFTFVKYLDASTDDLLKMCWSGKQIGKATFCAYRANGDNTPVKYLEVAMDKVVVSNLSFGGGGGDLPTENISLSYGKVQYSYVTQKKTDGTGDGVQPVSHDLITQQVA